MIMVVHQLVDTFGLVRTYLDPWFWGSNDVKSGDYYIPHVCVCVCVCVRARACIILDGHIDIQCSRQMEKACSEFMYI